MYIVCQITVWYKKVYERSPALKRSLGRPKNRWEDDVKSDITNMKITN
jgi:hypothetical protein